MADKILKKIQFFSEVIYKGFKVTDYESAIRFKKFRIAEACNGRNFEKTTNFLEEIGI